MPINHPTAEQAAQLESEFRQQFADGRQPVPERKPAEVKSPESDAPLPDGTLPTKPIVHVADQTGAVVADTPAQMQAGIDQALEFGGHTDDAVAVVDILNGKIVPTPEQIQKAKHMHAAFLKNTDMKRKYEDGDVDVRAYVQVLDMVRKYGEPR